ncbi:hypothetical protein [Persicobacter psychrovividus]|uniref:Uncharacterized protein n=1 Tax=Persicobacter psychrovividus TaxID=387638 RepID=A0ABM7VIC1_9BACT|nr:hypothetical protein PEPS_30100 [Persicobacter psychrovividus]
MAIRNKQQIDFMKAAEDVGKPLSLVIGLVGGKYLLKSLNKSTTVKGLAGTDFKEMLVPGIVTIGGLVGTQMASNEYLKLGLLGVSGAGMEEGYKKMTGKSLLQGLEGILGEVEEDEPITIPLNANPGALPAANLDIEAIMESDAMRALPTGQSGTPSYHYDDETDEYVSGVGASNLPDGVVPDATDMDVFAGDMLTA